MSIMNKEIEMIAFTDRDGKIKPIRFRLDENEELKVIPIKRVLRIDEFKIGNDKARKFLCEIELNDRKQTCEVVYILATMKWILYKI